MTSTFTTFLRTLWYRVKRTFSFRRRRGLDPEKVEERFGRQVELNRQWREGEISKAEMRQEYEREGWGWFYCDDCDWDGPHARGEMDEDDEDLTLTLHCPECENILDEV